MIEITEKTIDVSAVLKHVSSTKAGGTVFFIGSVREEGDLQGLQYDVYPEMAKSEMQKLVEEARRQWPIESVAVVHRVGWVPLGEASVVIAVSSAHRKEAYAASRFLIDRIKEVVPIWKEGGGHCECHHQGAEACL